MRDKRATLRTQFAAQRRNLDDQTRQAADLAISRHLEHYPPLQNARVVAAYAASNAEVDLTSTIDQLWLAGVQVVLPVVGANGQMVFFHYTPDTDVQINRFGILEPRNSQEIQPSHIDVVLAPLVAYDSWGNRLGMGGGYYDRYLPQTRAFILGVAYACQYSASELPHEPWDVRCHAVVTQNSVVEFTPQASGR